MATLLVSLIHAFFPSVFVLRRVDLVLSTDVQNCCAIRHSRLSIRDVEREASPTAVLAIPYCAYSDRW